MRIEYNKEELERLKRRVNRQLELLRTSRSLLPQIAILMYKSVMENFRQEGTDKGKWKPLTISTIMARRKGRKARGVKILQDTGLLRSSIFAEVRGDEAVVGTNLHYARIHQFGGRIPARFVEPVKAKALHWVNPKTGEDMFSKGHKIPSVKIPARPFLYIRREYMNRIINLVAKYVKQ